MATKSAEVAAALDLRREYELLGLQITGDAPNGKGWLECRAFDREDEHPSAAINLITGKYRDLGGGETKTKSIFDVAVALGRFPDFKAAVRHYADVAGVPLKGGRQPGESLKFFSDLGSPEEWGLRSFCEHKRPIVPGAVVAAGGKIAFHDFRKNYRCVVVALPVYGPNLLRASPVGWVMMNTAGVGDQLAPLPIADKKQPLGYKLGKIKNAFGSQPGLVGAFALGRLREMDTEAIWLVEGIPDLLALMSAMPPEQRNRHLVLSTSNGAAEHPAEWMCELFAGRVVYIVRDADKAGEKSADAWSGAVARHTPNVRVVKLPYAVQDNHGKDLRDWFLDGGNFLGLLELAATMPTAASKALKPIKDDDDPLRLARIYLSGIPNLAWWHEWFCVAGKQAYDTRLPQMMRAALVLPLETELDAINVEKQKESHEGEPPKAKKVHGRLLSDVLDAIRGICKTDDPIGLGPPFWLGAQSRTWPAREMFSCQNLLVHAPSAAAGATDCTLPHSPDFFTTTYLPFDFDPSATCPEWEKFIDAQWAGDQESKDLLQQWAGYLLLPDISHHKMLLLIGRTRSGKSTIAKVMETLVGHDNVAFPTLADMGTQYGLDTLVGKNLAIIAEARISGRDDIRAISQRLTSISGGDRQSINRKYLSSIQASLPVRFMIATNELPQFMDSSPALAGRFLVLETTRGFSSHEQDRALFEARLLPEMSGILNWALRGLHDLRASDAGFVGPASTRDVIDELHNLSSPVHNWADAKCKLDPTGEERNESLYQSYVTWCNESHMTPKSLNVFCRDLKSAFPEVERTRMMYDGDRVGAYRGIRLNFLSEFQGLRPNDEPLSPEEIEARERARQEGLDQNARLFEEPDDDDNPIDPAYRR